MSHDRYNTNFSGRTHQSNNNYNGNSRNHQQSAAYGQGFQNPQRKKSGAKSSAYVSKTGQNAGLEMRITNGWMKKSNGSFVTIKCNTTSKSEEKESGWAGSISCDVVDKTSGQKTFYWGAMEMKTGKVVISELALVINPKAPNGGYCGSFLNSNKR